MRERYVLFVLRGERRVIWRSKRCISKIFGDFCGLVAGRGSLVGLSTNSNVNKFLNSLGKECPEVEVQKKMVVELHNQNHVGAKMMFKMLFSDGYYWPLFLLWWMW